MSDMAVVNDNRVVFGATARRDGGATAARRFAADLERDDPRVNRVRSSVTDYAVVWLADGNTKFRPPDGYRVSAVFRSSDGGTAVYVKREDT